MPKTIFKMNLLLIVLSSRLEAASMLTNGEFAGSLAGWSVTGTVFPAAGAAVLTDEEDAPVAIFQTCELPAGAVELLLTFDYRDGLSPTVAGGFLRDTFFASLYQGRQLFGSTLAGGVYEQVLGLLDLDASGAFNVAPAATFGPSPKGTDWTRYTLKQTADPGFATVAFEFYNLNGIGTDSLMAIDNVSLTAVVPEPGAVALLLLSTSLLVCRRRRPFLHP